MLAGVQGSKFERKERENSFALISIKGLSDYKLPTTKIGTYLLVAFEKLIIPTPRGRAERSRLGIIKLNTKEPLVVGI